jgi:plastocyanin
MRIAAICVLAVTAALTAAQNHAIAAAAVFTARIQMAAGTAKEHAPAAVLWLKPLGETPALPRPSAGHYTLIQKNRMFSPHMLVIPVGSIVAFPNADPFFHNVFSLFNGKRFDLGLYEAGASKEVVFSREGVSYIFCNIHPEMSAVVLTLATPLYAVADREGAFHIESIPPGEYEVHVWVESLTQSSLDRLVRRVHIRDGAVNSLTLDARDLEREPASHLNKFGQPYDRDAKPPY